MSVMTLELTAEFSTRGFVPARSAERRALPRRSARVEVPSMNLFSLDQLLARRVERVEEDGERWDGLA